MAKLENQWREKFCKLMKSKHGSRIYFQKHHGSEYSAGLVDMLFVFDGDPWFIEFKAERAVPLLGFDCRKEPTKLQLYNLVQVEKAGARSMVVTFYDDQDLVLALPTACVVAARDAQKVLSHKAVFELSIGWSVLRESPTPFNSFLENVDRWFTSGEMFVDHFCLGPNVGGLL